MVGSSAPPELGADALKAVRSALYRGDLEAAEVGLSGHVGPKAGALWLEVGRLASGLGEAARARRAFARAAEAEPGLAGEALGALAEVAAGEGAAREYAKALVSAGRVGGWPAAAEARAEAMAAVGFAQLRARRLDEARTWLADAVRASPQRWDARTALVRLCAEDGDLAGVERWVSGAPEPPAGAAGWWMARGDAARLTGDPEAAEGFYGRAAEADPLALEPAEALVRLGLEGLRGPGREVRAEAWLDAGLEAIRRRGVLLRKPDRSFVAAACALARGGAGPEARRTYLAGRGAARSTPRGAPGSRWVRTWLGAGTGEPGAVVLGAARPAPFPEVVAALAGLFGVPPPTFFEAERWGAAGGQIGVPPGAWAAARSARFWLGRAMAALAEPSLAEGLAGPATADEPAGPATRILDRAGLVAVGDPAVALAELGPRTPRGQDLLGFAVSRPFFELREALGLGVEAPLPKGRWGK
jgi:tetratricopeptide (TPR) repeat protein